MNDEERALIEYARKTKRATRERSKRYRERKQDQGLVQVSVWVPASKAKQAKKTIGEYAEKLIREPLPSPDQTPAATPARPSAPES